MSPDRGASADGRQGPDPYRDYRVLGAVTTLATVTAIFYLSTFLVHYLLGWWGGISDLFDYYKQSRVVRKLGLQRDASVFVEMVELADDAASGRLLAAFSQGRESRDGMGRRQSADLVGRADRHDLQRDLHHREADRDAHFHVVWLSVPTL